MALSAMTGRILPPLSAILPLWLVRSMVNWKETREVWPALAVSGLSFAGMQYLLVELHGQQSGRCRLGALLAAGDGGVPEDLATGQHAAGRWWRGGDECSEPFDEPWFCRDGRHFCSPRSLSSSPAIRRSTNI
jgi:hypothetical protein